jgi:hypothetical protein
MRLCRAGAEKSFDHPPQRRAAPANMRDSEHSIDVEPTPNQCCDQNDNGHCTENALSALLPFPRFNWRLLMAHLYRQTLSPRAAVTPSKVSKATKLQKRHRTSAMRWVLPPQKQTPSRVRARGSRCLNALSGRRRGVGGMGDAVRIELSNQKPGRAASPHNAASGMTLGGTYLVGDRVVLAGHLNRPGANAA